MADDIRERISGLYFPLSTPVSFLDEMAALPEEEVRNGVRNALLQSGRKIYERVSSGEFRMEHLGDAEPVLVYAIEQGIFSETQLKRLCASSALKEYCHTYCDPKLVEKSYVQLIRKKEFDEGGCGDGCNDELL